MTFKSIFLILKYLIFFLLIVAEDFCVISFQSYKGLVHVTEKSMEKEAEI